MNDAIIERAEKIIGKLHTRIKNGNPVVKKAELNNIIDTLKNLIELNKSKTIIAKEKETRQISHTSVATNTDLEPEPEPDTNTETIREPPNAIINLDADIEQLCKIKKIGKAYRDRFQIVMTLLTTFKNLTENDLHPFNGGCCGSFVRHVFEQSFALYNGFSDIGFANPIGRDIDFVFYKNIFASSVSHYEIFNKCIKKISDYLAYSLINPSLVHPIVIANKTLIEVSDITLKPSDIKITDMIGKKNLMDIPHFIFKFKDNVDETVIEIDIMAHKPLVINGWENCDFNINNLMLNNNGIIFCDNSNKNNFIEVINCISNKEAICNIDFEKISCMTQIVGILRYEKVPYLMQIAWTLLNRFKILNVGYEKITSHCNMINFRKNTSDICIITGCEPPYYEIELKCNHWISIMAYIGIVIKPSSSYSQAINCPLCRENLIVNIISKLPTQIESINFKDMDNLLRNTAASINMENAEELCHISEDSVEYIRNLMTTEEKRSTTIPTWNPIANNTNNTTNTNTTTTATTATTIVTTNIITRTPRTRGRGRYFNDTS